ncbi:MAG: hypothetical protein JXR83_19725, partial [Deltaproteobacteria bacterium]|nr:hypothetical protein [Deltaproteobacteria bacterium]
AACQGKKPEEELTIVVREDTQRLAEEKQRLEQERKDLTSRKQELDDIEKNIRQLSDNVGASGDKQGISDTLSKLSKLQQQQLNLHEERRKELELRSNQVEADKKRLESLSQGGPSPGGAGPSGAEISAVRASQEDLRKEMASLRIGLAGVENQLKAVLEKLDKMPSSTVVIPPMGASGGKTVKRSVVDRSYREVQNVIGKKGLLIADLPPAVQGHNASIKKALAAGDYALAYDYVQQLRDVVKQIEIDRAFVEAKMGRLSQMQREHPHDKSIEPEVAQRFEKLTKLFTDGKYVLANREINEIANLLGQR